MEFLSQREFIATQIKEIEIKIDGRFDDIENKIYGLFNEVENRIDGRYKEIDKKLDKVNEKVAGLDKKTRDYLNLIQNASQNILRTRGWEAISPVGSLDSDGGIHIPKFPPRTIRHFWRLKDPMQCKLLVSYFRPLYS